MTALAEPPKAEKGAVAQPRDADAERARRDAVVASVGGKPITVGDVEDAIANKDPRTRARLAKPDQRERFLQELIRYDVLIHEAQRLGYATHPQVLHLTQTAAIGQLQINDVEVDPAAIPAKDVASYFAEHKAQFQRPAQRRATLVRLASADEARDLIAELRGTDSNTFAEVARERSTDARTAAQGGELGWFTREAAAPVDPKRVPQALIDAAFALKKVGDLSRTPLPIGDQFGILMLTAIDAGWSHTLAEAEGEIREQLAAERSKAAMAALVLRLEQESKPQLHPELLDQIVIERGEPPDMPAGFPADPPDPRAPTKTKKPDKY